MYLNPIWLAALLGLAAPAAAETAASLPQRTSALVVFGDDPCPKGVGDEVVVCARRPENERYRLPKRFRESPPTVAQGSWTNRVMELDAANASVLPNSCSPIGSNGQSGCFHQFLAEARAQRRAD